MAEQRFLVYKKKMFKILEKIDRALEDKKRYTLIDKSGRYYHGQLTDSWIRISSGKLRGKLRFLSDERGEIEVDGNDVLDLISMPARE